MYIRLKIYDKYIPIDKKHISTSWEISSDKDFKDLIFQSTENNTDLNSIETDLILLKDKEYYSRVKMFFTDSKGIKIDSGWIVDKLDKVIDKNSITEPSKIDRPILKSNYPYNEHPFSNFKIYGSDFKSDSIDKHIKTVWYIEDINGNLVWEYIKDSGNLTEIFIPIELETNSLYRVRAIYISDNNSSSEIGSLTLYISRDRDLQNILFKNRLDVNLDVNYIVMEIPNSVVNDKLVWELYREDIVIDSGINYDNKILSRIENLKLYVPYILKVKKVDNKSDKESTYFPFRLEVPPKTEVLDYFPLKFVYKFRS